MSRLGSKGSSRSYSDRTLKILWGRAAGRCAAPECRVELLIDATDYDPVVVIGDIAHIEAASDVGPRANSTRPARERDEYENLILLCKNCHTRIDGQANTNTVDVVRQLRNDHEAWVRANLPERGQGTVGWTVILLQGQHPIDLEPAVTAISPDFAVGSPVVLTADGRQGWHDIYQSLEYEVARLFQDTDPFNCRFAVFPLAHVSACLAFGFMLTNRPRVRLFQFHRDDQSWSWPPNDDGEADFIITSLPEFPVHDAADIAICFELSARISDAALDGLGQPFDAVLRISAEHPSTSWLRSESHLKELARATRASFERCLDNFPEAKRWHVFYAGPAPGAVVVGQQLNPTMTPETQLYEFQRAGSPRYRPSVRLHGRGT